MKATGVVIQVESGRDQPDHVERVTVKVFEAERFGWNKLTFPNVDKR